MGKYDRSKTPRVQAELARACRNYSLLIRLDIIQAHRSGRIDDEEQKRLIALVDDGQLVPGYGDKGDELSSKIAYVSQGYALGRVKI